MGYTSGNDWNTMRNANLSPAPDTNQATAELGFSEFGSPYVMAR
jgi:hypothetical protein